MPFGSSRGVLLSQQSDDWTPANLTLHAWWDAQAETYSNGQAIGDTGYEWHDQSGNDYDFTQNTSYRRPTYRTSGINSLPALEFDGNTDLLEGTFVSLAQPYTIAAVGSAALDNGYILKSSTGPYVQMDGYGNNTIVFYAGMVLRPPNSSVAANTPFMAVGIFDGTSSKVRANGEETTGNLFTADLGATINVGAYGSDFLDGFLGEIIIADGVLTTSEITDLEAYFTDRWGL